MIFPQIRCNYPQAKQNPFVFFVLCKGENAGKPALKPWTNSFAVICCNQELFDFYFWLIYALQQSGKFKIHLRGTAIPFINLADVKSMLREVAPAIHSDWARFKNLINTMDKLSKLKSSLTQQVEETKYLQRALLQNFFNSVGKKS